MLNTRMHSSGSLDQNSPSTHNLTIDLVDSGRADSAYAGLVDLSEVQKPSSPTFCLRTGNNVTFQRAEPRSRFVVTNPHLRECMAEFLGTFVMICFGFGVNNQVSLSQDKNGTWLSINMCWGVAVMLGVHCSEGISGAHLNPAVTIAMASYHRLPWRKVPGYILAQCLGAFIGAAAIFAVYHDVLNTVDPHRTTSRANYATYPRSDVTNLTAFYTEFLATALLVLGVFAITDKRNRPAHPSATPLHFMVLIWAIGMAFGMNTGYAINPARDFAPRLFTSIAGWGSQVFTLRNYYFWIPIVGPSLGGIVGGGAYKLFVEMHHSPLSELPV